jgi:hypothetical protein
MDPILLDGAQLRALTVPGLTLTPGRVIAARVIEAGGVRGQLAIAGMRVAAALPSGVRAGDELRLVVKDVSAERVVLQLQAQTSASAPPAEPREADAEEDGGESGPAATPSHVLALRYETRNLGPIDLRFELHGRDDALSVTVAMRDAPAVEHARANVVELSDALARPGRSDVAVSITAQPPPLDLYA